MTTPHIDTDVLIRLLTGDDSRKQAEAAALFERIRRDEFQVFAPDTVIADAVFVLRSPRTYGLPRSKVAELLKGVILLRGFHLGDFDIMWRALDIYGSTNVDFGDAMLAALAQADGAPVISYDYDFDRLDGVTRLTPAEAMHL